MMPGTQKVAVDKIMLSFTEAMEVPWIPCTAGSLVPNSHGAEIIVLYVPNTPLCQPGKIKSRRISLQEKIPTKILIQYNTPSAAPVPLFMPKQAATSPKPPSLIALVASVALFAGPSNIVIADSIIEATLTK